MQRRDFLTTTAALGLSAAVGTTEAADAKSNGGRYVLLEIFFTQSVEKRDRLIDLFDERLIPRRNAEGFERVGVFYVDRELMKGDRSYRADLYDSAVFVAQESASSDVLLNFQKLDAKDPALNLNDELDFVDEEAIAVAPLACQPVLEVPYENPERLLQLRTYNSPNYDRNFAKARMFEQGEWKIFKDSGMNPVFMGTALFGSWVPNITYMLSFENDEARKEGWNRFISSPEWKAISSEPQYARTATRIRNLFLRPSKKSQI